MRMTGSTPASRAICLRDSCTGANTEVKSGLVRASFTSSIWRCSDSSLESSAVAACVMNTSAWAGSAGDGILNSDWSAAGAASGDGTASRLGTEGTSGTAGTCSGAGA